IPAMRASLASTAAWARPSAVRSTSRLTGSAALEALVASATWSFLPTVPTIRGRPRYRRERPGRRGFRRPPSALPGHRAEQLGEDLLGIVLLAPRGEPAAHVHHVAVQEVQRLRVRRDV